MNTVYTIMLIDNYSKCIVLCRKKMIIIQIERHIVGKMPEKKPTHEKTKNTKNKK